MSIKKYRTFIAEKTAEKKLLCGKLSQCKSKLADMVRTKDNCQEGQDIINITGSLAQNELQGFIEATVTEALQLVFGSDYFFTIENKVVRNQPETYMYSEQGDIKNLCKDDMDGGGLLDVISIVLRSVLWAIQKGKTEAVMVLDEPLKNIDDRRMLFMGEMIRKFSELLGMQFIIVTHEDGLMQIADKSFRVRRPNDTSIVVLITDN